MGGRGSKGASSSKEGVVGAGGGLAEGVEVSICIAVAWSAIVGFPGKGVGGKPLSSRLYMGPVARLCGVVDICSSSDFSGVGAGGVATVVSGGRMLALEALLRVAMKAVWLGTALIYWGGSSGHVASASSSWTKNAGGCELGRGRRDNASALPFSDPGRWNIVISNCESARIQRSTLLLAGAAADGCSR